MNGLNCPRRPPSDHPPSLPESPYRQRCPDAGL